MDPKEFKYNEYVQRVESPAIVARTTSSTATIPSRHHRADYA